MATSGVYYTVTVNRDQLITASMKAIGALGGTEVPTSNDISDCNLILNMLVKQRMGKTDFGAGIKVFKRKRGYLFLNSTTGQYTVGPGGTGWTNSFVGTLLSANAAANAGSVTVASTTGLAIGYNIGIQLSSGALFWTTIQNIVGSVVTLATVLPGAASANNHVYAYQTTAQQPLYIESAVLRDSTNGDTPLNVLRTTQDYDALPNKADPTNISDPTAIYYEFQETNSNLFTDCGASQDVTKYMVLTYMEPVQDMVNPTDTFDYPQEYFLDFMWSLAKQIAPMYKRPWTQEMQSNYEGARASSGHKDAEVSSAYFQCGED